MPNLLVPQEDFDKNILRLLCHVAQKSPDQSSQNAAILVDPETQGMVAPPATNRFPWGVDAGIPSRWERPEKYYRAIHAETGAIVSAAREGAPTRGTWLYVVWAICGPCAAQVIEAGITRVVTLDDSDDHALWSDSIAIGFEMLDEANVEVVKYQHPIAPERLTIFARWKRVQAMIPIIGFSGYARAGKDTAANILVEKFGYKRAAYADALKDMLYTMNPLVWQTEMYEERVRDVVDSMGWDRAKELCAQEIRQLLQRLGTEAGRGILGDNIWVDTMFKRNADVPLLAISDVRFMTEVQAIESGGIVVRLRRDGIGPANSHISEVGLDDYPFQCVIDNSGSKEHLAKQLETVIRAAA